MDNTLVTLNGDTKKSLNLIVGEAAREAIKHIESEARVNVKRVNISIRKESRLKHAERFGPALYTPVYAVSTKLVIERWEHLDIPA